MDLSSIFISKVGAKWINSWSRAFTKGESFAPHTANAFVMLSLNIATIAGIGKLTISITIIDRIEFNDNLNLLFLLVLSPRMDDFALEIYGTSL